MEENNPNPEKDRHSEVQERILTTARGLFARKGFKATTTRMIATASGINEVTLFRNFQNKENIMVHLINDSFLKKENELLNKCLESEIDDVDDLEKMLIEFGSIVFNKILVENKELFFINLFEMEDRPQYAGIMSKNIQRIVNSLVKKFQELHKKGILPDSDFFVAALTYIQSLIGTFLMIYRMKIDQFPFKVEQLFTRAVKLILYGIYNGNNREPPFTLQSDSRGNKSNEEIIYQAHG